MDSDGYFVTSFPYDEDMRSLQTAERSEQGRLTVLGFACFPLKAGEHMIKISYTAPGFRAGAILSTISLGAEAFLCSQRNTWKERQKKMKKLIGSQIFRYVITGGFTTVVDYIIYIGLTALEVN